MMSNFYNLLQSFVDKKTITTTDEHPPEPAKPAVHQSLEDVRVELTLTKEAISKVAMSDEEIQSIECRFNKITSKLYAMYVKLDDQYDELHRTLREELERQKNRLAVKLRTKRMYDEGLVNSISASRSVTTTKTYFSGTGSVDHKELTRKMTQVRSTHAVGTHAVGPPPPHDDLNVDWCERAASPVHLFLLNYHTWDPNFDTYNEDSWRALILNASLFFQKLATRAPDYGRMTVEWLTVIRNVVVKYPIDKISDETPGGCSLCHLAVVEPAHNLTEKHMKRVFKKRVLDYKKFVIEPV